MAARAATDAPANITSDTTWTASSSPYVVSADMIIASGATLTMEPGVVVEVAPSTSITVEGALDAHGTGAAPVIFTNAGDSADSASWSQLIIATGATATLSHTDLRYGGAQKGGGGGDFVPPLDGLLENHGTLSFTDSTVEHTDFSGGLASDGALTFTRSSAHDLHTKAALTLGGTATIAHSSFGTGEAISATNASLTFSGAAVTDPVVLQNSNVHDGGDNTEPTLLDWESLTSDATFPGLPFVNVPDSDVDVNAGATLTIAPGAIVKAYAPIRVYGSLVVGAAGGATTTLTSAADDTIAGDTNHAEEVAAGVSQYDPTSRDYGFMGIIAEPGSTVSLTHARIRYAGDPYGGYLTDPCAASYDAPQDACAGAILNQGGTVSVADSTFEHTTYNDLMQTAGTTTITGSRFATSTRFAYLTGGSFTAHGNSIARADTSVQNDSATDTDATSNWWGSASGPHNADTNPEGTGPEVSAHVLFSPWLTSDPFAPPPAPKYDNVIFLPGIEASRLYMRDANGVEQRIWEPRRASDISLLALRPDGTSEHEIYTKDVIDSLYSTSSFSPVALGLAHLDPKDFETYGGFEHFMDTLVASSTLGMREWRAYPYDWRYDVRDIVANGTLTEMPDDSLRRVYLEDVLDELASDSSTGKVTIVAHSNGGLLAKALLTKLAAEGKSALVDRLVMVGTPQWGTPSDVGVMLHGDGGTQGLGLISYAGDIRAAAATMPGAYGLLPSPTYFAHVGNTVAEFTDDDVDAYFLDAFPSGVHAHADLFAFLTDALGLDASVGSAESLNTPLALSNELVNKANVTHAELDAWVPPSSVAVTSIAGWGQLTTYGYHYASTLGHTVCMATLGRISGRLCTRENNFVHTELQTEDGDGTVVAPSAAGNVGEVWYFDAENFQNDKKGTVLHSNIMSAAPIQNALLDLLRNKNVSESYILNVKPDAITNPLLRIGGMSPVNIVAEDASGKITGVVPIPGTDLYLAKQDIPGSSVVVSGEEKFVYLPQDATYSISANGYEDGTANVQIESLNAAGAVTQTTTMADIPVTAHTVATFSLNNTNEPSAISVDTDSDGSANITMEPKVGELVAYAPPAPAPTSEHSHEAPARPAGSLPAWVGGASLAPNPLPYQIATTSVATTSATTTVEQQTATSTLGVSAVSITETSRVASAKAVPMQSAPVRVKRPAPPARKVASAAQVAAAYQAEELSETPPAKNTIGMYHWLQTAWGILIHALTSIL
ncbi:MAG TPA: hypothetical protein VF829_02350 [Candidatus Paceibacterota bacterium]